MPLTRKQKEQIRRLAADRPAGEIARELQINEQLVREVLAEEPPPKPEPAAQQNEIPAPAPAPAEMAPLARQLLILGALLVLGFIAYANSLPNAFVFDDQNHLVDNPGIKSLGLLFEHFRDPGLFSVRQGVRMVRPLLMATHTLTYAIFGLKPAGFRLVDLLLHILNAYLVYRLLRAPGLRLGASEKAREWWARVGAALFLVHPAATETINYISHRSTLLSVFFILLGILSWRHARDYGAPKRGLRFGWLALTALWFVAGLLCRETTIVLPALIALDEWLASSAQTKPAGTRLTTAVAVAVIVAFGYLFYRRLLLGAAGPEFRVRPLDVNLLTEFKALALYLQLYLLPIGLNAGHNLAVSTSLSDPAVFLAALLQVGLAVIAWLCRRRLPAVALGIGWWFASQVLTTVVPLNVIAAENRIYPALPGLLMATLAALGWLVRRFFGEARERPAAIAIGLVLVIIYTPLTIARNTVWRTPVSIWTDVVEKSPQNINAWISLGYEHKLMADAAADAAKRDALYDRALHEYRNALALDPHNRDVQNNIANIAKRQGKTDDAIEQYEAVLRQQPDDVNTLNNLASAYAEAGRFDDAEPLLRKVLQLVPDYWAAYQNLGALYEQTGRPEQALEMYRRLLRLNPDTPQQFAVRISIARLLRQTGQWTEAHDELTRLGRGTLDPAQEQALQKELWELATALQKAGQADLAISIRRRLRESIGPNWGNDMSLGVMYYQQGDREEARRFLEAALENLPSEEQARRQLIQSMLDTEGAKTTP